MGEEPDDKCQSLWLGKNNALLVGQDTYFRVCGGLEFQRTLVITYSNEETNTFPELCNLELGKETEIIYDCTNFSL